MIPIGGVESLNDILIYRLKWFSVIESAHVKNSQFLYSA